METTTLTVGRNIQDSGTVTNQMLDEFIKNEVLTRLEYATITHGMGIYKGTMEAIVCFAVTGKQYEEALFEVGEAYKKAFEDEPTLILSPDSDFFKYFDNKSGK